MGIVLNWSDTNNRLYRWIKQYTHKIKIQGASAASRYLRKEVPHQLQKQVLDTSQHALNNQEKT